MYTWNDGRTFKGEWKNNCMHGKGVYTWPNGKKYDGDYRDDKKDGQGVYTWPDGRQYSGPWKKGKQEGIGRFRSKNGTVKSGLWEDGKRVRWISVINPDGSSKPINEEGQGGDDEDASEVKSKVTKGKNPKAITANEKSSRKK